MRSGRTAESKVEGNVAIDEAKIGVGRGREGGTGSEVELRKEASKEGQRREGAEFGAQRLLALWFAVKCMAGGRMVQVGAMPSH